MIADNVAAKILLCDLRPEMTPLSDVLAVTNMWRQDYEQERFDFWLKGNSVSRAVEDSCLQGLILKGLQGSWFIGKDPLLVNFPDEVLDLVERNGVCLLICVRDPLDVMASALEVQQRQSYGFTRRDYLKLVQNSFRGLLRLVQASSSSPAIYLVKYEDWATNWTDCGKRVADWLGAKVSWEGVPVSTGSTSWTTSANSDDLYHTPLHGQSPNPSNVGAFRERLPRPVWHYLARVFSNVRSELAYPEVKVDQRLAAIGALTFQRMWGRPQSWLK